jgi:two-component system phosphate regulon sensor histidine kinase PhoR
MTPARYDHQSDASDRMRIMEFQEALLAIASHDLRQPLQVILSTHRWLARRLTGEAREYLAYSDRAAADIVEKLDRITEALRVCDTIGSIPLTVVELNSTLEQIEVEFREPALQKGVILRIVPTSIRITSHATLLASIIRNLVRNAINATSKDGHVLVGCRRRGTLCRIEVWDTGCGIPSDCLNKLFVAFQRLESGLHPVWMTPT